MNGAQNSNNHLNPHEFNSSEIDFFAEDEHIEINPTINIQKLQLIRNTYGPFRHNIRISVPIWLAIALRNTNKCKIVPPPYLDIGMYVLYILYICVCVCMYVCMNECMYICMYKWNVCFPLEL